MEPIHIHIPYPKLRDYIELLRKREYDLEIYLSAAVLDQLEREDLEKLGKNLDWNPALTLHAPFMDLNPGAVDPMIQSVTQVRFRQLMNAAAIMKPRAAVFHGSYDRWRYGGRKDVWLHNSLGTWHKVMDTAESIGMRVAVENVFDEDPEAIRMLIEAIGRPGFGFCFDTGHFNLFSTVSMERWFEQLGRHLVEVHLHDNDGSADSHWALGRGDVDFEHCFSLMREHASAPVYTIEAHDKDDIETSLERVRSLLQWQGSKTV
ncbi:MAG TPA: sugar phosphate isomerase/epimerase family protein [Nitrospirota bacterium]|nr:sugar phosphate isomerase/epimerase family protein [Nitrospirota bacterium]